MKLFSQSYPENVDIPAHDGPPVVIVPGLFGSTSNWRSFAKSLSDKWPVFVVDPRNHGRSPHADTHTYADMVEDLREFLDDKRLNSVILCGHSMGGKVVMAFALRYPERVSKLVVMDIAPVHYTHSHAPFLEELMKIDLLRLESRSEADRALKEAIPEVATRMFLLQSLSGTPGQYRWRINLPVLHKFMPQIVGFPDDEFAGKHSSVDAQFIFGGASDYVGEQHRSRIADLFVNAKLVGIPGAGHWLHVEKPGEVLSVLVKFILNGEKND